jgi:hypothetical protein
MGRPAMCRISRSSTSASGSGSSTVKPTSRHSASTSRVSSRSACWNMRRLAVTKVGLKRLMDPKSNSPMRPSGITM